ncbi:uncharacterized protein LOC113125483 [Mastacembelus armatus]|uniref:uncharacterized protein LOC113125483 n=1 Tax=Mastacembelus armatus TaxID=205130 RepID=UPI000E4616E6|nr:uncharacterized protein LOC113125483 [Mastacembelus armatus]
MISSKHLKASGSSPWERFVTTYSSDYKPFSQRHLQVDHLKHTAEAEAAPAFINPLQTKCETWPISYQYFYKTTNSTYGSTTCSQPPSCSHILALPFPFGILPPPISEATWVAGFTPTDNRTQEVRVARETGHLLDEDEKGQLHCVCGGKANVLEQAKTEPHSNIDVLCEKGMIVLKSYHGPAYSEGFIRSLCREVGLQHLLNLHVAPGPMITNKDAEKQNSSFVQPDSRQCSCCAWETECPDIYTRPLAHVPPTPYCPERSRKPLHTEYQTNYAAEWAQPKIHLSDIQHRHPRCHWNPHPSL